MNLGLFGGTFDPIHRGHVALAEAARERFGLARTLFVPASVPPHKQQPVAGYFDRYTMIALATAPHKTFVPSVLEAPEGAGTAKAVTEIGKGKGKQKEKENGPPPNYSIDTIRRVRQSLKAIDKLFFLIGIDAFLDIAKWREAEALFREVEFIVASRPGYYLADVANALPESLRPKESVTKPFQKQPASGDLVLRGVTVHLLADVHQSVSATAVRAAVAAGKAVGKMLDASVADYIKKMGLYRRSGK